MFWKTLGHVYLTVLTIIPALILLSLMSQSYASDYDDMVDSWDSYQDVANWLNDNYIFDRSRQQFIRNRLQAHGPSGLLVRDPQKTYSEARGYCGDSAHFSREAINSIDPEYNAQWVFIENKHKGPNYWVTGFYVDEELYIMDYGAGHKWSGMKGVHGPYSSLNEYEKYLSSLDLEGFEVGRVYWRNMPGTVD